ncbi:hypothetical protein CEXT_300221 [Caerostris extrusa]|uniref:Uncharacterized protein n=1 Tax=Caerostris extrusa TaxID=172846 RepID=A0AAV4VYC8_CAEEX|nr:hypothetical protein CEXT_300221 [Caerostris extrusa]
MDENSRSASDHLAQEFLENQCIHWIGGPTKSADLKQELKELRTPVICRQSRDNNVSKLLPEVPVCLVLE